MKERFRFEGTAKCFDRSQVADGVVGARRRGLLPSALWSLGRPTEDGTLALA